jgi:hypothetical protein
VRTVAPLATIHREPGATFASEIRQIGKSVKAATDPNPISKTRSRSSLRAGGEQCALVLVKVRHSLMTAGLRCPYLASIKATSEDKAMSRNTEAKLDPRRAGFALNCAEEQCGFASADSNPSPISDTEDRVAVVTRIDSNEQESVGWQPELETGPIGSLPIYRPFGSDRPRTCRLSAWRR